MYIINDNIYQNLVYVYHFNYDNIYENGEIKSTKTSDVDEHGIGIKNVIKIIEKYGEDNAVKTIKISKH